MSYQKKMIWSMVFALLCSILSYVPGLESLGISMCGAVLLATHYYFKEQESWREPMGLYDEAVDGNAKLKRGQVWCIACGETQKVNSRKCLSDGWPKCCGSTMTLDSPEERSSDGKT